MGYVILHIPSCNFLYGVYGVDGRHSLKQVFQNYTPDSKHDSDVIYGFFLGQEYIVEKEQRERCFLIKARTKKILQGLLNNDTLKLHIGIDIRSSLSNCNLAGDARVYFNPCEFEIVRDTSND